MKNRQTQVGMTLIEVMVAILIFAIGVLGLVALQAQASRLSGDAEDRSNASLLANEAVSMLWASYAPPTIWSDLSTPTVNPSMMAAWQSRVSSQLPNATGTIATAANNITTVTITWRPPNRPASIPSSQYVTQVVIQ